MQIRGEKFLKWPKLLKKDSGNQSKYCDFHRSSAHSTEDYKTLQREIEELIRRGHLAKFIKGLKKNQPKTTEGPIYGLDNEPVPVQGTIQLEVTLDTYPKTASRTLTFLVVDLPLVYNAILGSPCLTAFGAVTSIPYLKMKFPMPYGVEEVLGDQVTGRTYYIPRLPQVATLEQLENLTTGRGNPPASVIR
ncbi:hypothetical protein Nepgr_028819 [Nepenthes gracilis]|uniref:Uncharacterized protein n=1 Tax=Nepenthes gracilis TaxID=150966 RepID=A0AAD3TDS0_NEPGR|nr:hypothetical protein Nepgr_028819 [Nepenthes gracilis]